MTETFIIAVSSPRLILHRGKQNCFVAGLEILYPVHMARDFSFFFPSVRFHEKIEMDVVASIVSGDRSPR